MPVEQIHKHALSGLGGGGQIDHTPLSIVQKQAIYTILIIMLFVLSVQKAEQEQADKKGTIHMYYLLLL